MTDEQKDLAKELYNKFIDKGSTTIPYEKITPIYIKEGNSSPFIYFTTLDSDYAFDTRQDDNSLTHKFTKDDIDNTELLKDRKRVYAICTNELPDTSYFRSAYDHLLRVGFDKDYEYISNNKDVKPTNIKESLLEHTGEIFDNLKPVGASDKTFELYDKFSRERKTIREKLDDGYEIYEVSKGAKGISDIFKKPTQSVEHYERSGITYMKIVVNRRTTNVDIDFSFMDRYKLFLASSHRVVNLHFFPPLNNVSTYFVISHLGIVILIIHQRQRLRTQ